MLVDREENKISCFYAKSKLLCPVCGGKLGNDKQPFVSDRGFIYRNRHCLSCHAEVSTKQRLEEITHIQVVT